MTLAQVTSSVSSDITVYRQFSMLFQCVHYAMHVMVTWQNQALLLQTPEQNNASLNSSFSGLNDGCFLWTTHTNQPVILRISDSTFWGIVQSFVTYLTKRERPEKCYKPLCTGNYSLLKLCTLFHMMFSSVFQKSAFIRNIYLSWSAFFLPLTWWMSSYVCTQHQHLPTIHFWHDTPLNLIQLCFKSVN